MPHRWPECDRTAEEPLEIALRHSQEHLLHDGKIEPLGVVCTTLRRLLEPFRLLPGSSLEAARAHHPPSDIRDRSVLLAGILARHGPHDLVLREAKTIRIGRSASRAADASSRQLRLVRLHVVAERQLDRLDLRGSWS